MTTLYFPDFVFEPRNKTFKAAKSQLAYPRAKPIGGEFLLRACWGRDINFVLSRKTPTAIEYEEVNGLHKAIIVNG